MKHFYKLKLIDELRMNKIVNPSWAGNNSDVMLSGSQIQRVYENTFRESVDKAVVVDIQNMVPLSIERINGKLPVDSEHYPDFRLPFPSIWFEYDPVGMDVRDPKTGIEYQRVGILARNGEDCRKSESTDVDISDTISMTLFAKIKHPLIGSVIVGPVFSLAITVDAKSVIQRTFWTNYTIKRFYRTTEVAGGQRRVNGIHVVPMDWSIDDHMAKFTIPAVMALQFMNCRNVIQDVKEPPSTINERHRREHPPLVTYRVLRISRKASPPHTGGAQVSGDHSQNRYHVCRGHFKRFTEDKPLLGRHVGTYWWESHARGNRERGEVIKDYEIGPSQGDDYGKMAS